MDQVRMVFRVLWQQRFWVLSVVGILIAAVCWMMATGHIQAEFVANQATINTKFGDMDSIVRTEIYGNDRVNAKNEEQAGLIKAEVLKLWKQLYDSQRESVLKWPAVLGDEFLETVKNMKFRDDIKNQDMRRLYWNYIKNRFNDLVDIVQAKKLREGEASSGFSDMSSFETPGVDRRMQMSGMPGMPPEEEYIVQWVDQGDLRMRLDYPRLPSSLQIWVTQEDLWVYETLLHAIANTNKAKKATRVDNAAIRGIIALEVGPRAAMASSARGNIIMPEMAVSADGGAPIGPESMPMGREGVPMDPGMATDGANPDAMLLASRYVDQEGNPIADDSAGFGVEYRRLPIRMRLYMDQRWLPKILIECANAPLPIEVQRVRINPEQSGAGFDQTMGGMSAMAGGMGMEGYGGRGGIPSGYGDRGGRGGGFESSPMMSMPMSTVGGSPELAQVEIQGLVYIYNEPDQAALAVPGGEETTTPADATVAAAQ